MAGSGTVPRAEGKGLRCWRKIIWVGDSQKSNIDRTVDLTPNSVEWTTWALGELPNNGEIYYDRDLLKAIRKKADLWGKDSKGAKWPNDVARHSMNSYVVENKDFNVVGFWNSCLGREQAIFKKNYQGRVEYQADRTAYFGVLPPGTESLEAACEETKREFHAKEVAPQAVA